MLKIVLGMFCSFTAESCYSCTTVNHYLLTAAAHSTHLRLSPPQPTTEVALVSDQIQNKV
jgi:hypothetical protein